MALPKSDEFIDMAGVPTGWYNNFYWSDMPTISGFHEFVDLYYGYVYYDLDSYYYYVAVQVL